MAPDSIRHIQDMPTCVDEIPRGCKGVHESTLRAWNVLRFTEWLLERGTPSDVVLALIKEMEQRT